ncbi:MAG: hypothetical protein SOZ71_10785 [Clostridium sp.]|nr:hypothetical protein [Clostridium sp.]
MVNYEQMLSNKLYEHYVSTGERECSLNPTNGDEVVYYDNALSNLEAEGLITILYESSILYRIRIEDTLIHKMK